MQQPPLHFLAAISKINHSVDFVFYLSSSVLDGLPSLYRVFVAHFVSLLVDEILAHSIHTHHQPPIFICPVFAPTLAFTHFSITMSMQGGAVVSASAAAGPLMPAFATSSSAAGAGTLSSFYGPLEDTTETLESLEADADADMLDNIDFAGVDADLVKFQRDSMVQEALAKGVDLRGYSDQIEQDLYTAEAACVAEYVTQANELAELDAQIKLCDGTLEKMESLLSNFQQDLGVISSQIHFLQDKSMTLSIQLQNRKAAERKVSKFVRHAYIAPDLMNIILREGSEHSAQLATALTALSEKIFFHQVPDVARTHAAKDAAPALSHLFAKAAARVRMSVLTQIRVFKQPKTHIQSRQAALLHDRGAYTFLLTHCSSAGVAALMDGTPGFAGALQASIVGALNRVNPLPAIFGMGLGLAGLATSAVAGAVAGVANTVTGNGQAIAGVRAASARGATLTASATANANANATAAAAAAAAANGGAAGGEDGHAGANQTDLAAEVRRAYVDTLCSIYTTQFNTYLSSMQKLGQENRVRKEDLLAAEQGGKIGGLFGLGKKSADDLLRVFAIGQRELVLTSIAKDSIVLHVAAKSGMGFPFERLFRSAHQLLVDTVASEMDFLWAFFGQGKDADPSVIAATAAAAAASNANSNSPASNVTKSPLAGNITTTATTAPSGASAAAAAVGMQTPVKQPRRPQIMGPNGEVMANGAADGSSVDGDEDSDSDSDGNDLYTPIVRVASSSVTARTGGGSGTPPPPSRSAGPGGKKVSFTRRVVAEARARARKVATALGPLRTHHVYAMFAQIFQSVLNSFMEHLENYLFTCYDSIGVLILIRMVALNNQQMQERNISVLDSFFDRISMLLWSKFKALFDANFNSLVSATSLPVKKGSYGAHFVVQRYAEYAAALRRLNFNFHDEIIEVGLSRMARVIEGVIKTLSVSAAGGSNPNNPTTEKARLAFCVNNYDVIVRTFHSKSLSECPEAFLFADLMVKASADFVEVQLSEKFADIITFVKEQEARLRANSGAAAGAGAGASAASAASHPPDDARVERLVRGFVSTWRASLEAMHTSLQSYFSHSEQPLAPAPAIASPMAAIGSSRDPPAHTNPGPAGHGGAARPSVMSAEEAAQAQALALMGIGSDTGSEVLKKCLLQLVLDYKRFQDVLSKIYVQRQPAFLRDMVQVQTILYEIKKLGSRTTL